MSEQTVRSQEEFNVGRSQRYMCTGSVDYVNTYDNGIYVQKKK